MILMVLMSYDNGMIIIISFYVLCFILMFPYFEVFIYINLIFIVLYNNIILLFIFYI
jgi:hypothetical protein